MLMNGVKSGSDIHVDEANGNVDSAIITDMQENVVGELDVTPSLQLMNGQLDFPSCSVPELNDKQRDLAVQDFLNSCNSVHSDNRVGNGVSLWSEYIDESLLGKNGNDSINLNVAQVHGHDVDITGPFGESISDPEHKQRTLTLEDFLCYSDNLANQVGNGGSIHMNSEIWCLAPPSPKTMSLPHKCLKMSSLREETPRSPAAHGGPGG